MKKTDYVTILDILIDDGVMKSIYKESTDNMLKQVQLQWTPTFKSGSCRLRFS